MRHLHAPAGTEVVGNNVLSLLDNMQASEIAPHLQKHGLTDVQPDEWYLLESWLNVMNDLADHTNFTHNLVAIGLSLASKVPIPFGESEEDFVAFLEHWGDVYHKQHRGGEIGTHVAEKIDDRHYRVAFTDVYPDDLKFGLAHGFAKRILPNTFRYVVKYEDDQPRMDKGGADTTYLHITWQPK